MMAEKTKVLGQYALRVVGDMIQMHRKLAPPSVANIYLATQRLDTTILAFAALVTIDLKIELQSMDFIPNS
jgi:hypothetical protein